ncbi:FAST kinase domain-containing protein 2, mitochondrial [Leptodactylus fuscus]|uniref:FAST kinase domain-containing protein 2, mitochondrial n=1 Tax=Leptodactylus fuscus TaxID=238119 RepID=UPI003F4F1C58
MHNMPLPYLVRTVRLLQSCHCVLGIRIPSLLKNHCTGSGLLVLHEMKPWTPASIATSVPIRFLHKETSISAEERNTESTDHNHALSDEYDLRTDVDHGMDGEKTMLQGTSIAPPKKLSCVEVLDAFSNASHSRHEIYCTIMDLFNILTKNKKLSDKLIISEHPNFHSLCYEVMKAAPLMSSRFLVYALYVFVNLKVDQRTRLIQTLLSVSQQRLSTLKLDEISILANATRMMNSDKNVDILNAGLHLLIELKCEEIKDVPTLLRLMRIAPPHLRQKFEEKALQMTDKFTVPQCYNMVSMLAEKNLHSESLLDTCSRKLIDCLDELSCKRIISLTGHCSRLSYFNEKLLSAIGNNIMNNIYMWNIWQISVVLTNMAFLRFRYVPLLDYFADKIMQDLQSLRAYQLATVAKVYSMVNHLPEGKEDKFLEFLNAALELHNNSMKRKELLRTIYNFCLLGLVSPSSIRELLEDESLLSTMDPVEKSYVRHIKLCLLLESGSSPYSVKDLENVEANHSHSVAMCHSFLKNHFNDPSLYQENMQFPSSYFIDFVLTLDTERNKLVPTGNMQNFEGSQNISRIAVLCCTANAFTLGSLHPVGKMALKIRHLKSLGFTVVLIPVNQFIMLTEAKKVEFLRENIFKEFSANQSSEQGNEVQQLAHHET